MIQKIVLSNFRNFTKRSFEFSLGVNVIVGRNAAGKTNILESIFLLSTGKSFRARIEAEMINHDADIARIAAVISSEKSEVSEKSLTPATKLDVVLTRGTIDIGNKRPEAVPKKKLLVNGVSRHLYNFSGNLKIVLFGPWDMDLVTESPSIRRRFLDNVLSLVDREYRRASLSYDKGLRQRNKLLFKIREEGLSRGALLFWDQLLIKSGDYITKKREEVIDFINLSPDFNGQDFSLDYDRSPISEGRLAQYKEEEVLAATTLVGPHRDDFIFKIKKPENEGVGKDRELARYGSRGEQRMGVLWLKLAELSFVEKKSGEKPTLLLDDIFSELDHEHRDIVIAVCKNQQTIITTADEHFVEKLKANYVKLS